MLTAVTATRYVTPLREGGSLPGLMEADDLGTYVVKFHGAGQGRKTLVAEVIVGHLGSALGLPVPELVTVDVDPGIAKGEPDQEVQDLLRASGGMNLGIDFLPGSLDFDPSVLAVDPVLAGRVLWFDAFVGNVDRSWRNPNLLVWHGQLWLIDHGAALTFHHKWATASAAPGRPYEATEHALIGAHGDVVRADDELGPLVTPELLAAAAAQVPDEWLADEPGFDGVAELRQAYVDQLSDRLRERQRWLPVLEAAAAAGTTARAAPAAKGSNRPSWLGRRESMTAAEGAGLRHLFEYALLRVVPSIERGECINAGVIVYCRPLDYLGCRTSLDVERLHCLDPAADAAMIELALSSARGVCSAAPGSGPAGLEEIGRRFRWLTAPRSTVVQPGPVHTGLTADPEAEVDRLLTLLVERP